MSNDNSETAGKLALRPLNANILVRQEEYKERLESGLFLPQGSRAGYKDVGVIVAMGSKATIDAKVGDRVMFKRKPGSAIVPDIREGDPNGWKNLLNLTEEEILAVIEE